MELFELNDLLPLAGERILQEDEFMLEIVKKFVAVDSLCEKKTLPNSDGDKQG